MVKVPLAEATTRQLFDFLTVQKGVEMEWASPMRKDRLLAKLSETGYTLEFITYDPEVKHDPVKRVTTPDEDAKYEEKMTILISRSEGVGGDEPIPLAVNGKYILAPRGEPISLARKFVEVLKNCIKTIVIDVPGKDPITRDVVMYPFQIISGPHIAG